MSPRNQQTIMAGTKLDRGQQRILRWLERYPFQRGQDLVVALAPWEGRGAVYRRLAALQQRQLIESVPLGASPREELYHLSPVGKHVCLGWHPAHGQQGQAASLGHCEEREKLVRLLPRVPIWLVVQDLVNSLVLGAAQALLKTGTGTQVNMVRWNWLRDYTQTFLARGQAERALRVRTEGALALCFPTPSSLPEAILQDQWQTFLLLYCPLDERSVLSNRLDRLVRWRESAERWSVYSQMPPVLILATTPRQAEWWQRACAQVATTSKVASLVGAVASLPKEQPMGNAWRLAWRTLGTNSSCHIQDLVHTGNAPALPELAEARVSWDHHAYQEAEQVAVVPILPHESGLEAVYLMGNSSDHGSRDQHAMLHFSSRRGSVSCT